MIRCSTTPLAQSSDSVSIVWSFHFYSSFFLTGQIYQCLLLHMDWFLPYCLSTFPNRSLPPILVFSARRSFHFLINHFHQFVSFYKVISFHVFIHIVSFFCYCCWYMWSYQVYYRNILSSQPLASPSGFLILDTQPGHLLRAFLGSSQKSPPLCP